MNNRFNGNRYNFNGQYGRDGFNLNTLKSIPLTYIILFINIVIYIVSVGLLYTSNIDLNQLFGRSNYDIINGEIWRLVLPIFLHDNTLYTGILHIAFNSYFLYVIGIQVEHIFSRKKFLLIYFIAGIFGNILGFAFSAMNVLSVGASGALMGLLGAMLYYALIMKKKGLGTSFLNNILFVIAINLFFGFTRTGIDNMAHIGGIIGGYFIARGLGEIGSRANNQNKQNKIMYIGGLAVVGIILLIIGFSRSTVMFY